MLSLKAKVRDKFGNHLYEIRENGFIPAVLYGEGIESAALQVLEKEFDKVFKEAGESSLLNLEVEEDKTYQVLIHQTAEDPLTGRVLHIDFFKPSTKKKVEAEIPLEFFGLPPAVKDLGGVLVRELQAVEVKGLASDLPRHIKVDVSSLKTFGDKIFVKDLKVPAGIVIERGPEEIVAHVAPPKKAEEKPKEVEKEEAKAGEEGGEKEKKEGDKKEEN